MNRRMNRYRFPQLAHRCTLLAALVSGALASPTGGQTPAVSIESSNEVSGVRLLEPGKWGVARTVLSNRTDHDADALVIVGFPGDPLKQYCTQAWVPARSAREILTRILPPSSSGTAHALELNTRLLHPNSDQPGAALGGQAPVTRGRFDSAIIATHDDSSSMSMVAALRQSAGLKPTTIALDPRVLPATAEGYESIDSLFLCSSELTLRPDQEAALEQYVERGGRLWVMLDAVSATVPETILGDRWGIVVLDRVEVTCFTIDGPSGATTQKLDHGVQMVRVCAPGYEITHTISGSPALLRKAIGRGDLVVSTLSSRAWLDIDGAATPALGDMQAFVMPRDSQSFEVPNVMAAFDNNVRRAIGYQILPRETVMAILGGGIAVIAGSGLILSRRRRLDIAAGVSVACALATGTALIGMGRARQTQTASVAATNQFILSDGRSNRIEAMARTSIYISPGDAAHLQSLRLTRGGTLLSDGSGSGSLERMIWRDTETCELQGIDLRPGAVTSLTSHLTTTLPRAAHAVISVDSSGVRGRLDTGGGLAHESAVLVTPSGSMMLTMGENGAMAGSLNSALDPGSFGGGALMTEEQISRQQVCRELWRIGYLPNMPSVLVWTDAADLGMSFPVPTRGSALLVIPLTFEAPVAGTEVVVPSALLTHLPVRASFGGRVSAALYDAAKKTWLAEIHQPQLVMMQFRPPEALAAIDVHAARLSFDLRAPGQEYDVVIVKNGLLKVVGSGVNPNGRVDIDLAGDSAPEMSPDGQLLIGLDVRQGKGQADGQGWSLQRMELSIRGNAR